MQNQKIIYIISGIDYSLGFEWLEEHLDRNALEPVFVFLNNTEPELHRRFLKKNTRSLFIPMQGKKEFISVFFKLCNIIRKEKPNIVHTHLFNASLLGLTAAWCLNVQNRIYTRHHSTYHFEYHPRMVKYDRYINFLSTKIIAITENVRNILVNKENVIATKVFIVNHGFDLEKFINADLEAVKNLKLKYNLCNETPVIGVISRFTEWKGVQFIIPAFCKLLDEYPEACLILANADGDYKRHLEALLENVPAKNLRLIPFERDLYSLYKLFDIFVHVPIDREAEAFGQTYVEALAAGIPSVFTSSGIASEFIVNRENALLVPHQDVNAIFEGIRDILKNDVLKRYIIKNGRESVVSRFKLSVMMSHLMNVYNG